MSNSYSLDERIIRAAKAVVDSAPLLTVEQQTRWIGILNAGGSCEFRPAISEAVAA